MKKRPFFFADMKLQIRTGVEMGVCRRTGRTYSTSATLVVGNRIMIVLFVCFVLREILGQRKFIRYILHPLGKDSP